MSVKYMGHAEILEVRKNLAKSGFITFKENNDPFWNLFVSTGNEPGRSSDKTMVGNLYSLQRRETDTYALPSNRTFSLRFQFDAPETEEIMHSFWIRDFARRQKAIKICNYKRSSLIPSAQILADVAEFRDEIEFYSTAVLLPRELARKSEQTVNRSVLPFYLAGFTPEVCSIALRLGVAAASPVATALREGRVSEEKAAEYVNMPHDWVVSFFFDV